MRKSKVETRWLYKMMTADTKWTEEQMKSMTRYIEMCHVSGLELGTNESISKWLS